MDLGAGVPTITRPEKSRFEAGDDPPSTPRVEERWAAGGSGGMSIERGKREEELRRNKGRRTGRDEHVSSWAYQADALRERGYSPIHVHTETSCGSEAGCLIPLGWLPTCWRQHACTVHRPARGQYKYVCMYICTQRPGCSQSRGLVRAYIHRYLPDLGTHTRTHTHPYPPTWYVWSGPAVQPGPPGNDAGHGGGVWTLAWLGAPWTARRPPLPHRRRAGIGQVLLVCCATLGASASCPLHQAAGVCWFFWPCPAPHFLVVRTVYSFLKIFATEVPLWCQTGFELRLQCRSG